MSWRVASEQRNPEFYFVGDDLENDCLAPVAHGWRGIWLDRSQAIPANAGKVNRVESLVEFADLVLES